MQGTLDLTVYVGVSDTLNGSLTYDGTLVGDLQVSLNGGVQWPYDYDLDTDTVNLP